jgi:hypothetical protein
MPTFLLVLALAGCSGESRIEAPDGGSASEPAERPEPAPKPKKAPAKPARAEAIAEASADAPPAKAAKAKDSPPPPASAKAAKTTRSARAAATDPVASILNDLKRDPKAAREAYLKIWEIPPGSIPRLIDEVENTEASQLGTLDILVLDADFLRPGEIKPFLANRIHGLGRMEILDESDPNDLRLISQEYTKMSYGITRNKHYKVVLEKDGGFPIGVVVRAGLINRVRSTHYPASSDDVPGAGKLIAWWRDFYNLTQADLEAATK